MNSISHGLALGSKTISTLCLTSIILVACGGGSGSSVSPQANESLSIVTIAGTGMAGNSGDNGPATSAEIGQPTGLTVDANGNLYITDPTYRTVRKISTSGIITTVAGKGYAGFPGYGGDFGPATVAKLNGPSAVSLDALGNLYISDSGNRRVRKVDVATGIVTTVAGNGTIGLSGDNGPATSAGIGVPTQLVFDAIGNMFFCDSENNVVRKVDATTGTISTVAGNGYVNPNIWQGSPGRYSGDNGAATNAELNGPTGLAIDAGGNLYIADTINQRIRKVSATSGIITTVAGTGYSTIGYTSGGGGSYVEGAYSGDNGPATSATLNYPKALALASNGDLYIADSHNMRIRKVSMSTRIITTVVGNGSAGFAGDNGAALDAKLTYPEAIAFDANGSLYIADSGNGRIRKVKF